VPDPINPISIVDGDTHINKYPGKKIYIGGNEYLPVGTVLMYNGSGIADAGSRSTPLGDEPGDTIKMPGWYVCNGNAGTPNLLNKFVRAEAASGTTGGSDDGAVVNHTHVTNIGAHGHNFRKWGGTGNSVNYYVTGYHGGGNAIRNSYNIEVTQSVVSKNIGNKTSGNPGGGVAATGVNKPARASQNS
jgi:hypothetical protein